MQYLNDLRLENAEEELINTNKTILDIALDNGFAGSAALGKAIKKKYDMTPVQFGKKTEYYLRKMTFNLRNSSICLKKR